jgi:hypothetical protein
MGGINPKSRQPPMSRMSSMSSMSNMDNRNGAAVWRLQVFGDAARLVAASMVLSSTSFEEEGDSPPSGSQNSATGGSSVIFSGVWACLTRINALQMPARGKWEGSGAG